MAKKPTGGKGRERRAQKPTDKRSALLSVRVQPKTKEDVEAAAASRNCTVSLEVDRRLAQSFSEEEALRRAYGAPHVRALAGLVGLLATGIEQPCAADWRSVGYVTKAIKAGLLVILEKLGAREGDDVPRAMLGGTVAMTADHPFQKPERLGELVAAQLLSRITGSVAQPRTLGEFIAAALVGTNTELSPAEQQIRRDLQIEGGTQ